MRDTPPTPPTPPPGPRLRRAPTLAGLATLAWLTLAVHVTAGSFALSTRTTEIPERGEVTTTVLRTSQYEFSFLAPHGWRSEVDVDKKVITWISPDYASVLRFQLRFQGSGQPNQLRTEDLRQVVLQELPAARIIEEFVCPSGSATGMAFDVERPGQNQLAVSSRMAFLPLPGGGRVEILLSTPRDQFRQRQVDFTGFLNSFLIAEAKPN